MSSSPNPDPAARGPPPLPGEPMDRFTVVRWYELERGGVMMHLTPIGVPPGAYAGAAGAEALYRWEDEAHARAAARDAAAQRYRVRSGIVMGEVTMAQALLSLRQIREASEARLVCVLEDPQCSNLCPDR